MYPSTVLSPAHWWPMRYVLCELEIKYSESGRVMSCEILEACSPKTLLSEEVRKEVKPSR